MTRERIFPTDEEDRSFDEQMDDLGVEVVKPEQPRPEWYEPKARKYNAGRKNTLSIKKTSITVGANVIAQMGVEEGSRVEVGVIPFKKGPAMAVKLAREGEGIKITKSRSNSYGMGTKKLCKWLQEKGVELGRYTVRDIDGGWIAVPEGGGGE